MQAQFRSDYAGEFVVVETKWSAGKKQQIREWVPNPIENHHISGRAACIGSNIDKQHFDYTILQRHRGGLLGSKKLQTYGTGSIAAEMKLDFTVETAPGNLQKFIENRYSENNIVYTTAKNCIGNAGNFYLTPYTPHLLDIATIVYLAAFDEHKEIFLLGYHQHLPVENAEWYHQVTKVMESYSGSQFYFVSNSKNLFAEWLDCANASNMTYREFISYCDV